MGTYELHPRGAWALAADSLRVYARKLVPIVAAAALLLVPLPLLFLDELPYEAFVILLLLYVAVAPLLLTALMIVLASHHVMGVSAAPRQLLRRIQPVVLLRMVAASVVWVVLMTVVALPGIALQETMGGQVEDIAAVYFALSAIVIGGPVAWLLVRLLFVLPAAVLENAWPLRAVHRSFGLTRGAWWRLLGAILIGVVLWFALAVALAALGGLVMAPDAAAAIAMVATAPMAMVFAVVLYYDARVRREFLDVRDLN